MSATIVSRETSTSDDAVELMDVPGARFAVLPLSQIIPNSRQPRQVFDAEELRELSASITEVGVLQPVVVRPIRSSDEEVMKRQHLLRPC